MALRFMDGFDHYTWAAGNPPVGDLFEKWTGFSGGGGGSLLFPARSATARTGSGAAQLSNSNLEVELYKTLDDQSTWIVGWGFRINGNTDTATQRIFYLQDSSGAGQLSVYLNFSTGQFTLYRGLGVTGLVSSASGLISVNAWNYLEVKAVIANSGGVFELRKNEQTIVSYTGDTQQHASLNTARTIRFCGDRTQTGTTLIDDVYICDGTGTGPDNDYLGDCKVQTIMPNGNGNSSVLVGSDGNSTDNYLLVDEAQPNDATDYVESSTPGDKDTYTYGNLSAGAGTVYGIQMCPNAQKTDAGTRTFATVARHSGTEEDSADMSLGTTWAMYQNVRTTKPGGGAWGISDINGAEFGVKVTA